MDWWLFGGIAALVVLAIVLAQRFGLIDLSDKSRRRGGSSSSSIIAIGDEVFSPTRHEAQLELDRQSRMPAPAPIPGDGGEAGIFEDGRIVIRIERDED